jgi:hypothetical protein
VTDDAGFRVASGVGGDVIELMGEDAGEGAAEEFIGAGIVRAMEGGFDALADFGAVNGAEGEDIITGGEGPGVRAALVEEGGEGIHGAFAVKAELNEVGEDLAGGQGFLDESQRETGLGGEAWGEKFSAASTMTASGAA